MDIFLEIIRFLILLLIGIPLVVMMLIFIIQTIQFTIKAKYIFKKPFTKKWKYRHYLRFLRMQKYALLVDFLKWLFVDTYRLRDRFKLFGIWCFTGYYGQGKTLGCLLFAKMIKRRYPDYHIATNFFCNFADIRINKWEDLINLPRKTIVIFDEIQSTFTSTAFAKFPIELLERLTQCRKLKLAIFASSPIYTRMSIQLRESTDNIVVCRNILDRMFNYTFYKRDKYEAYVDNPIKLRMNRMNSLWFTASDWDYRMYNTEQLVKKLEIDENANNKIVDEQKNKNMINDMLKNIKLAT